MIKSIRKILSYPEWWLVIVPLIAYRQVAFFQNTMQWDMTDQVFVWHRFISECFHQHLLPLWCPYSRLGYPFFADPQSGLFYPVTWIFTYFFDYSLYTNNLEFIIHVIGGAFGMKFLLESLHVRRDTACVFGLVYALSGPFVSNATHNTFIYSLCWLPFILGSYIRVLNTGHYRYSFLMAIFLYLQISGGYIGISIIVFYVLVFIFLYYLIFIFPAAGQKLSAFIFNHLLLLTFTLLLSFGFVYAVLKGLPYIDRQNGITKELANSIAFTPYSFLTFLFPGIINNDFIHFGTDLTMRSMYMGLFTLLLAMISLFSPSRIRLIISAGVIFFLMAALGSHAPVRGWLYDYVPLMDMFRMAAIFRFFACIGLIILAAYSFDEMFDRQNDRATKATINTIKFLCLVLFLFLCVVFLAERDNLHRPGFSSLFSFSEYLGHASIWSVVLLQGGIHLVILGFTLLVFIYLKSNALLQKYLIAAFIIMDLCIAVQGNIFSTIVSTKNVADMQAKVDKLPKGFPIVPNVSLASFNQWTDSSLAPPLWHNAGFLKKQIAFDGFNSYNLTAYNQLYDGKDFYRILSERKVVSAYPDSANISIVKFDPDHISFIVSSGRDETIYVGQFYFPGWKVKIDEGKQASMLREDSHHLMKCDVPRGEHLVEMSFEPAGVRLVFIYTLIAFVISGVSALILFYRAPIL